MNRDWPTVSCTRICIDVRFGGGTEPGIVTGHLWPILFGSGSRSTMGPLENRWVKTDSREKQKGGRKYKSAYPKKVNFSALSILPRVVKKCFSGFPETWGDLRGVAGGLRGSRVASGVTDGLVGLQMALGLAGGLVGSQVAIWCCV
jgi:hypothetical protein